MLGLATQRDEPPVAALHAFLGGRRTLLLLDNFEVVDAAAPLVSELLREAPGLVVLATSRAPLRLSGEHQHRVGPLPLPDAVRLFSARARAVAPSFRRPGEEADEVTTPVPAPRLPAAGDRARGGADARLRARTSCSPRCPGSLELAVRGGARPAVPPAHAALHDRLEPPAARRRRSRRRSRASPCSPAAAATRAPPRSAAPAGRRSRRSSGRASSTSASTPAARCGGSCSRPSASTRSSCWTRPARARTYRRRHAEHYAELAEALEDEHPASGSGAAWRRLEAEQDNFRAALDWSRARDVELELRLVGALAYFWATSDHLREGRARLDDALRDAAAAPAPLRAKALAGAALVAHSLGDYERMRDAAEASLELFRALGDERRTALALNQLGIALSNLGDIDGGIVCHEENAAISRRLGDGMRLSAALNNLGYCLLRRDRYDRARALFEEGLAVTRAIGHRTGESVMLGNLGLAALLERRPADALEPFRSALLIDRELAYTEGLIYALVGIAAALSAIDGAPDAATLLGAAQAAARATRGRARAARGRGRGTGDGDAEGGARRRAARPGARGRARRSASTRRSSARSRPPERLSAGLSGSQPRCWTVAAMFPHTLVAAYAIRFRALPTRGPRAAHEPS